MTESPKHSAPRQVFPAPDPILFEGSHSLLYLSHVAESAKPVIIKVLKKEQPSLQEIAQFNNEFEQQKLEQPWRLPDQKISRKPGSAKGASCG